MRNERIMITGMITLEVVPTSTSEVMLRRGRAKRSIIVVPVNGLTLGKIVELKNTPTGNKWTQLLTDTTIDLLRPLTMRTIAGSLLAGDDEDSWSSEEALVTRIIRSGVITRVTLVLTDDDTGDNWSMVLPEPDSEQVSMLLGVQLVTV